MFNYNGRFADLQKTVTSLLSRGPFSRTINEDCSNDDDDLYTSVGCAFHLTLRIRILECICPCTIKSGKSLRHLQWVCQYFTMYSGLKPDITLSTTELTMIDRDRIRWISTVFRHLIDLAWRTWIRTHTHIFLGQINCSVYMQMEKFRKAPCEIQFPESHWMKICKQGNWYCRPVRKSTRYPFPWAAPKDNGPFTRSGSVSIFSGQ